jgi:hypothetical protein
VDLSPIQENRSLGFALRFRPTYAGANVGHPSSCLRAWLCLGYRRDLEARVGIEPTHKGFADPSEATINPLFCNMSSSALPVSVRF